MQQTFSEQDVNAKNALRVTFSKLFFFFFFENLDELVHSSIDVLADLFFSGRTPS